MTRARSDEDGPVLTESDPPKRGRPIPPVLLGMIVDAVDFATLGPIGLYGGFVLGGLAAYWAAREAGMRGRGAWLAGLAGAVYAGTPATEMVPLATIIGTGVQLAKR